MTKSKSKTRRKDDHHQRAKVGRVTPCAPGPKNCLRPGEQPLTHPSPSANPQSAIRNPKFPDLVSALLAWFSQNARDLPWRRTTDPYAIWISEIMLQQTQVKTVIPYWERWMRELPTVESLAHAKPEKILKLWEGLGYYTRVRNAQKAALQILEKHNGIFPETFGDILALPGIGRYTAGAISSIAFDQPTPILDGNVIRVLTRVFGIAENPRDKEANAMLWELAEKLVTHAKAQSSPRKTKNSTLANFAPLREENCCSDLNQSLMELGALICSPRQPKCDLCPLQKLCIARGENRAEAYPNLAKRESATQRRFIAFVVKKKDCYLVRQRTASVVNAHLWEFPNVEISGSDKAFSEAAQPFLIKENSQPLCHIKHSITRYRISLEAFHADLPSPWDSDRKLGLWKSLAQLDQLPFTSAHRKILEKLKTAR